MLLRKIAWSIQDNIFLLKMFFYDYIIDPIKDWYSDNFWLGWSDEDTYVSKKDSYYNKFKDFKNGTSFRCHCVWNSSKNRPQKIKDIQIIKKKNYGNRKEQETF